MKKIAIFGGSGFIGSRLTKRLCELNNKAIVFTREPEKSKITNPFANEHKKWDLKSNLWLKDLENIYAVVNLSGASVAGKRWTKQYKNKIYNSRILTTKKIVQTINSLKNSPAVYVNASAVGYYGHTHDKDISENAAPGNDFLAKVCTDWENEALKVKDDIRTIIPRIGLVLDNKEGALPKMLIPYKFFVGGAIGNGCQFMPWIHIDDLIEMFVFTLFNDKSEGTFNLSAPNPVKMNEFNRSLSAVLKRPGFLKVPEFAIKLLLGEQSTIILNGQKAIPQKALENGYEFKYSELESALINLLTHK